MHQPSQILFLSYGKTYYVAASWESTFYYLTRRKTQKLSCGKFLFCKVTKHVKIV